MKCPKCQAENPDERKFCRECGVKLAMVCPECGTENLLGDKFCGECGQLLEEIEEVAMEVIKKTLRQKKYQFKTGVSRIVPKEFGLIDGMGPGGIIVFVLEVFDQKIAYVIIDGNNMVSGFRENINFCLF